MIHRRRGAYQTIPGGFFRFQSGSRNSVYGFGEGDYIRLRDEYGSVWRGVAERDSEGMIRYRFRDENGRSITGISDNYGVILRDDKGKTWRGFVD
ncbi:MAG TPA: hypothetical protein VE621_02355 [Bryobacteraceae bacterium]|jgi:hypothetical protein|nr:hypothetical protein [Bryobacteraceae bacterium]